MTDERLRRAFAELELERRRRELRFWTVRGWLAIAVLTASTVALLRTLVVGDVDPVHLAAGLGLAGAGSLVVRRRG